MNYNEEILKVKTLIQNKEYHEAENILLAIISEAKIKEVESEENIHFSFNNYVEYAIFWNLNKPKKRNKVPDVDYSFIYYYLGFINYEFKNYEKAEEYLKTGLKWNPVDVNLMFELAATYKMQGNLDKFRAQIEKTHQYIYESSFIAKYLRELGWYYSERRIFDVANALYTHSTAYLNTELAQNELMYIAKQENREKRYSTREEVQKLLPEYNISTGFNRNLVNMLFNEYDAMKKDNVNNIQFDYLCRTLYDITLDKKFMLYNTLNDDELGVSIKLPRIWRYVKREDYDKNGISKDIRFFLIPRTNQSVRIVYVENCKEEDLEQVYLIKIDEMKNNGMNILAEYSIDGQKKIKQVFFDVKRGENTVRVFRNYLVVNNYLFNVEWEVVNNMKIEDVYNNLSKSFAMDVIWSFNKISAEEKIDDKKEENNLKMFSQEIPDFPTFKFYFPEDLGEYVVTSSNVFEIKKDNIQKIRVMISKSNGEEALEVEARKWIEKNKESSKMEEVEYRKEKINNIPLEVYVLKYIDKPNLANKIYKIGYVNNCRITISGGLVNGKEKIINQAFEKIKWDDTVKTNEANEISFFDEWRNDLNLAYSIYTEGNITETLKVLDKTVDTILKNDKIMQQDIFWNDLAHNIYKAVVLNNFYNQKELTPNSMDSLLANDIELKNNIAEFCNNFRDNNEIDFIKQIENISEKMLKDIIHVLMVDIGKMNLKK